jgi:hypothetical protein
VIGADVMSAITDYADRDTCVLFGGAAGAVFLGEPRDGGEIVDHVVGLDVASAGLISVPAGGSRRPASPATVAAREHSLRVQGREVFRFAVHRMPEVVADILARNGFGIDDLSFARAAPGQRPHPRGRRAPPGSAHVAGHGERGPLGQLGGRVDRARIAGHRRRGRDHGRAPIERVARRPSGHA